jgi:hypothetical protein
MANQRQFQRFPIEGTVTIADRDRLTGARLLDLSLRGALTDRPAQWQPELEAHCRLSISLLGAETPVVMECRVAHIEPTRIGFHCLSIDIDSISFLRRMVELNIGEPAVLERELSALG